MNTMTPFFEPEEIHCSLYSAQAYDRGRRQALRTSIRLQIYGSMELGVRSLKQDRRIKKRV